MRRDDIDEDPLIALERRVRRLERGASLGYSSVSEGALRILSVDGLIVEGQERVTGLLVVDGTLQVAGTQTVSGTLVVTGGQIITGTFRVDGDTTHNGKTTFVGETDVTGIFNVTGTTTITGPVGLTGTLTVEGGGQIRVGDLVISPSVASGTGLSAPVRIVLETPLVEVQSLGVAQALVVEGPITAQSSIEIAFTLRAEGNVFLTGLPTTTEPPNLHIDGYGRVSISI